MGAPDAAAGGLFMHVTFDMSSRIDCFPRGRSDFLTFFSAIGVYG